MEKIMVFSLTHCGKSKAYRSQRSNSIVCAIFIAGCIQLYCSLDSGITDAGGAKPDRALA